MLADPIFKVWTEPMIIESVGYMTVGGRMTEVDARQFIYDQLHPERPEGHPAGVFFAHQLDLVLEKVKNQYPYGITQRREGNKDSKNWFEKYGFQPWELESYGICDNVEQILSVYLIAEIPDRKFCIGMCPMSTADISEKTWQKNGHYLGTHETEKETVYMFHIYELGD